MASKAYTRAKLSIKNLSKASRQDRMADYKFTMNGVDALFGNLSTTGRGLRSDLTTAQGRVLNAMSRLSSRTSRQSAAAVRKGETKSSNMFGSAMGNVIHEQFAPSEKVVRATGKIVRTGSRGEILAAKGGRTALDAQLAGAREAASGAEYATATALKYRAQQDASLIADKKATLANTRLQAQLAAQQAKLQEGLDEKLAKYQSQLAQNETAPQGVAGTSAVTNAALSSVPHLNNFFNTPMTADEAKQVGGVEGAYPTAPEAAKLYIAKFAITDENEQKLVIALASKMALAGAGPDSPGSINYQTEMPKIANAAITQTFSSLYPDMWKKHKDDILPLSAAYFATTGYGTEGGAPAGGGGGGGDTGDDSPVRKGDQVEGAVVKNDPAYTWHWVTNARDPNGGYWQKVLTRNVKQYPNEGNTSNSYARTR